MGLNLKDIWPSVVCTEHDRRGGHVLQYLKILRFLTIRSSQMKPKWWTVIVIAFQASRSSVLRKKYAEILVATLELQVIGEGGKIRYLKVFKGVPKSRWVNVVGFVISLIENEVIPCYPNRPCGVTDDSLVRVRNSRIGNKINYVPKGSKVVWR